jgi:hypothetical protein
VFLIVFVTGIFDYSCYSGAVRPAGCCSAAGRARSESAVPVLCSGFLRADGCADSNYCEVSSYSFSHVFLMALSVVLVSLLYIAVSCC